MSEIIHSPSAHLSMWKSFADKAYRHAYSVAHVGDFLAMQLHSMRLRRGWTQKRLAQESGNTQPQISKFETSCEGMNLSSLHKLAEAFDVALLVKFVPFSQLAKETIGAQADLALPSFDEESPAAIGFSDIKVVPAEPRPFKSRTGAQGPQSYFKIRTELSTGGQAAASFSN